MSDLNWTLLAASILVAATPILLAAIGELVVEKAGVLNLGVEGMMIVGAVTGFIAAVETGSPAIGFLAGAAGAVLLSLVFGVLTQFLMSNQVATGLALTLFGLGLSALIGQGYVGIKAPRMPDLPFGELVEIPFLGPVLFRQDAMVWIAFGLVAAVWWFLRATRAGLILRAVGEGAEAAHALGYRVALVRLAAIAFGGAMAGLGGAYISLARVPQWTEGMTAGAGWIALALVVFGAWRPWRVLLGAWLFGGAEALQLRLQAADIRFSVSYSIAFALVCIALILGAVMWNRYRPGIILSVSGGILFAGLLAPVLLGDLGRFALPVELLSMSPYLVTILVLVIISSGRARTSLAAPADLGRPFHAAA